MNIKMKIDVPIRHRLDKALVSNKEIRIIIIDAMRLSSKCISKIVSKAILIRLKAIVNIINLNSGSTSFKEKGYSQYSNALNTFFVNSLLRNSVFGLSILFLIKLI